MRRIKDHRALDSLLISVILHIIFVVILASYITVMERQAESAMDVAWVDVQDQKVYIPRRVMDQPYLKRVVEKRNVGPTAKASNDFKSSVPAQAIAFSNAPIVKSVEVNPRGVVTDLLPSVTTESKVNLASDLPISGAVTTARGAQIGKGAVTGRVRAAGKGLRGGLSIIDPNMGSGSGQDSGVLPDNFKSPTSLREDELGGILLGRGSDVSGHIRLIRVRHGLSDWWQDPTALTGMVDWLNKNTRIRADMKVAGGVLKLDDSQIFNAPIIIITGHDRSVTMQNNLMQPERSGGKLIEALTPAEKAGLREYLVDRGGMLFFDDCGFKGLFADEFKAIMREVLPEYNIENVPKTHEIFNCYYNLPGPPKGSEMFWGSENEGKGAVFPTIQGISIGRRLAVVISRKDYLCSIETVEIPSHTQLRYRYSPDVYKLVTNLVVYAMKYGGITDRTDYD